jgi:L-alanine-DL-glutamate epimerase-like enolase superfamily enzyme
MGGSDVDLLQPSGPGISSVHGRAYRVPTDQPEADGTLEWSATTVVAVLVAAGDSQGLGWTYASDACQSVIEAQLREAILGEDAFDVPAAHEAMVRACRNLGRPGVVASAISAADIALWDLKARLLGVSLSRLFGRCRDDVPLYGSGGFTTYDERTTAAQLEGWVGDSGIPRVKIKIGESWGTRVERDLARVALSRGVIGDGVELYTDANGAYTVKQAVRVGRHLEEDHGVTWFEEPVSSDNLTGLRQVRGRLDLDVAAGEYGYDETYFARMIGAEAVDCLQADVTRCGGYTSWLRVAAIAAAAGMELSGHCAPNLHAPVAAAIPNLRHVEYFHDHSRLDPLLFDGVLVPRAGALWPDLGRPGHGMELSAGADGYRVT